MNYRTRIVFTNIDKESQAIGYLQIFTNNKATYNYEIFYNDMLDFPYCIKDGANDRSLKNYLNKYDMEKVTQQFNKEPWINGSTIFKVESFNKNISL